MKHIIWTLPNGFQLPMVKLDDGTRLMTAKGAAGALGCSERALSRQIERHRDRLSGWAAGTSYRPKELSDKLSPNFLKQLKEALELKYARSDIRLLIDADFLYLSAHVNSEQAVGLTQAYIAFIISQTQEDTISREEYETLKAHYDKLEERMSRLEEPLQVQAKAAGQMLASHRRTKGVRNLPN